MNRLNFLNNLSREGKIQIVEPSVQVCEAYRKKSESYLISAKILFENGRLEETVSLAYYSMYYPKLRLKIRVHIPILHVFSYLTEMKAIAPKDLYRCNP